MNTQTLQKQATDQLETVGGQEDLVLEEVLAEVSDQIDREARGHPDRSHVQIQQNIFETQSSPTHCALGCFWVASNSTYVYGSHLVYTICSSALHDSTRWRFSGPCR